MRSQNFNFGSIRFKILRFREIGILIAFSTIFIILSLTTSTFFQFSNIILVFRYASFTGIMALGAVFLLSQGDIDLSVGSIYNIVGILIFVLLEMGWAPLSVIIVGLAAGVLCGFVNITLSIYLKIPMLIITLGTMNIYRGLGLVLYDARPKTEFAKDNFLFEIFGGTFSMIPFAVIALITMAVIFFYVYGFTRFGIHVRSIGGNIVVARALGVKINKTRTFSSMLNGSLAAVSAILTVAYLRAALPSFGTGYELLVLAAAILGGTALSGGSGSILGAVLGALVISLIVNGIAHLGISTYWSATVTGTIIIAAVILDYLSRRKKLYY